MTSFHRFPIRIVTSFILIFLLFLGNNLLAALEPTTDVPPELDAYIQAPDDSYRWEILESDTAGLQKSWLLELTSQTWHGIAWKHYLYVVEPGKLLHPNEAILFIGGSRIGRNPRESDKMLAKMLVEQTNCCMAMVFQVPNQPLFGNHVEDALIGETFLKAIDEKDTTWPLLFPMTKSAVRAMDAVQEIIRKEREREIKHFIVSGASKRGWTTWLTAATGDARVLAIAPIVIDTLNIAAQMPYQLETWGDWSASIHDYTSRGLVDRDPSKVDPFKKRLWAMIDPYSYRSRLNMPKMLVHGTNDPYWTVDASQKYWDGLPGPKFIATFPNVGHDLGDQKIRAFLSLAAFCKYAFSGNPWPETRWTNMLEADGSYRLQADAGFPVKQARLWIARSETKDFRKAKWTDTEVRPKSGSTQEFDIRIPKPETGHIAYFLEWEVEWSDSRFSFGTQVWRF